MWSKSLTLLSVLCVVIHVEANGIHLGFASPQSRKIFGEIREANPALWTRTDDVVINTVGTEVISAITVTDLRDDKDGQAYIESGGIGGKSVTIGLRSPSILRGYRFEVEVFAEDVTAKYYNKVGSYPTTGYSGVVTYPNSGVKGGISAPYYDNGQYARKWK